MRLTKTGILELRYRDLEGCPYGLQALFPAPAMVLPLYSSQYLPAVATLSVDLYSCTTTLYCTPRNTSQLCGYVLATWGLRCRF